MSISVLVVDDYGPLVTSLTGVIKSRTGLDTVGTSDSAEAISIVRRSPIRVVVLDQKMPGMTGVELFAELRKVDPKLKAILLTGEAERDEVGTALNVGFALYVSKDDSEHLATEVARLNMEYVSEAFDFYASSSDAHLLTIRRGFLWRSVTDVRLLGVDDVSEGVVLDAEWRTFLQLRAGETRTYTERFSTERTIVLEQYVESSLGSDLGVKASRLVNLESKMQAALKKSTKNQVSEKFLHEGQSSVSYELPAATSVAGDDIVVSRHFQYAFVRSQVSFLIGTVCRSCEGRSTYRVTGYVRTNEVETRQIDYTRDGRRIVSATGRRPA